MAEGEVDPDILAAIAASKQDHHGEEEEDPAVLAAIEASKQEAGAGDSNSAKVVEEKEPKKESKGPILMFSTLGRSTEPYDEDDTFDSHVTEEEPAEEDERRGVADDDVVEPGDLDPDDAELPAADLGNGDEAGNAGGGKKKKEDFLTPTLRRAYITKVKPEKRYCSSDDDSDGDWGGP